MHALPLPTMARVPSLNSFSSTCFSPSSLLKHSQAASILHHPFFRPSQLLSHKPLHSFSCPRLSLPPSPQKLFLGHFFSSQVACSAAGTESGRTATENDHRERLVQHLLVKEDQLQLLLELQRTVLQDGLDLSDLATEYSICASKKDGGMLGWVRKGQMVPEFEEIAFTAPLNKVVRVKTKFGWHLLQALSEREGAILQDIQPEDLYTRLQDARFSEEVQLMDVRESHEISTASIEGFKPYALSQFGQWAPTITSDLDPSKDTYVLCHHGVRSMQAAQWLQTQGFKRIYNVAGGIHQYSAKADNNVPVY